MRKTEKLIVWLIAITMMFFFAGPCFAGSAKAAKEKKEAVKVNINTATEKELLENLDWDVYKGKYAEGVVKMIIQYREKHGPFKRAAQIQLVPTFPGSVYDLNKSRIVVK